MRETRAILVGTIMMISSAAMADTLEVKIVKMANGHFMFDPLQLTIAVGDKVKWTNTTSQTHTVTPGKSGEALSKPPFTGTDDLEPNDEFVTPDPFGASQSPIDYHCDIHPDMVGTIVVK